MMIPCSHTDFSLCKIKAYVLEGALLHLSSLLLKFLDGCFVNPNTFVDQIARVVVDFPELCVQWQWCSYESFSFPFWLRFSRGFHDTCVLAANPWQKSSLSFLNNVVLKLLGRTKKKKVFVPGVGWNPSKEPNWCEAVSAKERCSAQDDYKQEVIHKKSSLAWSIRGWVGWRG